MADQPAGITAVRWPSKDANVILTRFVMGGPEAGRRAPRGIDPEYVSYWLRENVKADCPPGVMLRTVELLRFYERRDALEFLSRMLTRNEDDSRAFSRAMYILQAIGEVGTQEQAAFASRYCAEFLLPRPVAMEHFTLVLETAEALSIAFDLGGIGRRVDAALAALGDVRDLDSSDGIRLLKYRDYRNNNLPAAVHTIGIKRRLQMANPAERLQELLYIYLGESSASTTSMQVWSGRMLREFAMKDSAGQETVLNLLGQVLDGTIKSQMPKPKKDFLIHRSAQAILYLNGKLSFPQQAAYEPLAETGPENYLWDDPGTPGA